jgi:hypothetical protein
MVSVKEQRICFKVGITAAEAHIMLNEAYSDNILSQMMTYEWFKRFKNGRASMDDDDERTSTSRSRPLVAQVKNITMEIVD